METPTANPTTVKLIFWGPESYKTPCGRYMISPRKFSYWKNNVEGTVQCHEWTVWDCTQKCFVGHGNHDTFRDVLKFTAKLIGASKVIAPRGRKD